MMRAVLKTRCGATRYFDAPTPLPMIWLVPLSPKLTAESFTDENMRKPVQIEIREFALSSISRGGPRPYAVYEEKAN